MVESLYQIDFMCLGQTSPRFDTGSRQKKMNNHYEKTPSAHFNLQGFYHLIPGSMLNQAEDQAHVL